MPANSVAAFKKKFYQQFLIPKSTAISKVFAQLFNVEIPLSIVFFVCTIGTDVNSSIYQQLVLS